MKKTLPIIICVCLFLTACAGFRQPTANKTTSTSPSTTNQTTAAPGTAKSAETAPGQPTAAKALPTWEQRYSELKKINSWTLNGSVSIQHTGKTDIASMRWQQQQMSNYNLMLFGPLSMGRVGISSSGNSVTLARTGKQPVSANSAEQLMQQQLGWELPVSNMYYWVRGIPAPGSKPNMAFDDQNHLTQLNQQGWTINYQGYEQVQQVDLPKTIALSNPRLHVRLVVKNWNI